MGTLSIVLPCFNEASNLKVLLPQIQSICPQAEIIVVNDGSIDNTKEVCAEFSVSIISHPYSIGNGAAIKSGARHAKGDVIVFMDGDGQHDPSDIPRILEKFDQGFEMVIGARHTNSHASSVRWFGNWFYNRFASAMTGRNIEDLTCGFRAVRARVFRKFLYLLPNGFSYPTTSTMAFFRAGFPVAYVGIHAGKREGKSHIKTIRDGIRFLIIIVKIGALFSPMRLFLPISAVFFTIGVGIYSYNFMMDGHFTNLSVLVFVSSIVTFLIGILSEQISSLHYRGVEQDLRRTERD